jgi:hypothetical protein
MMASGWLDKTWNKLSAPRRTWLDATWKCFALKEWIETQLVDARKAG